ncbi:MAG: TerB family tellurite resistance protein [Desulfobulbaceae bacterium]|nr:TerB family tellurite resistance protein [Desulfobulbaceae bacterium]
MQYQYRYHQQPGCGGCLLYFVLLLLLFGGAPLLLNVVGFLLFSGLFTIMMLAIAFWGFTLYIRKKVSAYEHSQTETHNVFVFLLVNILIRIAKMDGVVTRDEINTINNFFQQHLRYDYSQMQWVKELIKEAQASDATLEDLLVEFRGRFGYEHRLILLELIYQVTFTNHTVSQEEMELLDRIGSFLGISAFDHQSVRARNRYRRQQTANVDETHYRVLGLSPGATAAEVKKAYRTLSMQYHPDKAAHLGEEFRSAAEEKMKEINMAYQHLQRKLNNG